MPGGGSVPWSPMRFTLLAIALLAASVPVFADDLDDRLAGLLRRAESDDSAEREAVRDELRAWCEDAGEGAEARLRKAAAGAKPEAAGQATEAAAWLDTVAEARKRLGIFDGMATRSARGLEFVTFNTGKVTGTGEHDELLFLEITGWLVEETDDRITLLTTEPFVRSWSRKPELPENWEEMRKRHPADRPLPGARVKADFDAACRRVLEAEEGTVFLEGWWEGVEVAVFARWALERGRLRMGMALWERALERAARQDRDPKDERSDHEVLFGNLADEWRWRAICWANEGLSRRELAAAWRAVAALPAPWLAAEAKEMAAAYESLLREDEAFRVLGEEELGRLEPAARARYYVLQLRDVAEQQQGYLDFQYVLGFQEEDEAPSPPALLVKLGDDAIDPLIEKLDDTRPTRCLGDRGGGLEDLELLTIGEACRQILEQVTGMRFEPDIAPDEELTKAQEGRKAQAKAKEWWQKVRTQPREERFLQLLETNAPRAAQELVRIDAAKHVPVLLRWADEHPTSWMSPGVLREIESRLEASHREPLERLARAGSTPVASTAALLLWTRCGSDAGVAPMAELARKASDKEAYSDWYLDALRLFAQARSEAAVQALLAELTRSEARMRAVASDAASGCRDRRVAEELARRLDDTAETGTVITSETESVRPRVCDHAAQALMILAGRREPYEPGSMAFPRPSDEAVEEMKRWWRDEGTKIDWK